MRGAITLSQSDPNKTYKFKISFDFLQTSVQFKLCVHITIINVALFVLPFTSMWEHALNVVLPHHHRPKLKKKTSTS